MLICYISLTILTIIRGDDNIGERGYNRLHYETNIKNPLSDQYLPTSKIIPVDENVSVHKFYGLDKVSRHSPYKSGFLKLKHQIHYPLGIGHSHHAGNIPPLHENALLMALLLSTVLSIPPIKHQGHNHPDQVPINPYITLLLSQYGHYLPVHARGTKGLYYYAASNNYHNNKPFGSYKVYEETR